ncbi:MAG TPA: hypothetical protein VFY92_03520 [Hyphomicrobiaceae bacterium]|nr:hypothetical protein [Hyphomicrobiaceae bacterium]
MNILFVMKTRGDAGSTHAVVNYARAARRQGHWVAIYGTPIWYVPDLPMTLEIESFDRVVYLFESELHRIKPMHEAVMLTRFPRAKRLIIDTDGMYNRLIQLDGYDFNHRSEAERERWVDYVDALGDRVAHTVMPPARNRKAMALPFFGYNPELQIAPSEAPEKQYDILHLGHNWWRWRQVSTELLPAIEQIRDQVGAIAFTGLWWDQPPSEGPAAGPEEAFESDPEWLRRLRIETPKAVMYHDVIKTMSSARINIMTQRPLLRHLRHLTLKYFEIFCADTIPLMMLDRDHVESVYGPAGRELVLDGDIAGKLLDALHRPDHYGQVVEDVRRYLDMHHSYDRLVQDLVAAFDR